MFDLQRETRRRWTLEAQGRLMRAMTASALTGVAIYLLVMRVALPALQAQVTPRQVEWLRQAFAQHPGVVLGTVAAVAALLGLPMLGVFRWVYGPWNGR